MRHQLEAHHKEHLRKIGVIDPPDHLEIHPAEYQQHAAAWRRTLPNASREEIHKHVLANAAWRQQNSVIQGEPASQIVRHEHEHKLHRDVWLLVALILGLLLLIFWPGHAHAQFSRIKTITFQHANETQVGSYASPFSIIEGTNVTFAQGVCPGTDCGKIIVNASSTAATAWSGITSGTNANAGSFIMSVGTFDYSGTGSINAKTYHGGTASGTGACASHFWVSTLNDAAAPTCTQPSFADISSTIALAQLPTVDVAHGGTGQTSVPGSNGQLLYNNAGAIGAEDPIVSPNQDTASTAAWTSATAQNTAVTVAVSQRSTVTVSFNGSSISGGAVTFEVSPDNTNWYPKFGVSGDMVSNGTSYTLTGANESWTFAVAGYTNFRVRLSTAITGAGTANIAVIPQALGAPNQAASIIQGTVPVSGTFWQATQPVSCLNGTTCPVNATLQAGSAIAGKFGIDQTTPGTTNGVQVNAALPTGSNTIGGVNLAQYTPVSGRLPVDGSGVTQPVSAVSLPLPTGASTAANQTATQPRNLAQIAGVAPSFCDSTFVQNGLASSGNTVITTATAAQKEYVCGWSVNGASTTANTVKLVTGTGGTCGTGQTDFSQAVTIQAAASQAPIGIVVPVPMNAQMATGTNVDLCVNLSAAQAVNVIVWYHKGA